MTINVDNCPQCDDETPTFKGASSFGYQKMFCNKICENEWLDNQCVLLDGLRASLLERNARLQAESLDLKSKASMWKHHTEELQRMLKDSEQQLDAANLQLQGARAYCEKFADETTTAINQFLIFMPDSATARELQHNKALHEFCLKHSAFIEAYSTLPNTAKAEAWQPIETVPVDKVVQVYYKNCLDKDRITNAYLTGYRTHTCDEHDCEGEDCWCDYADDDCYIPKGKWIEATWECEQEEFIKYPILAWQPKPEPPKAQEQGER